MRTFDEHRQHRTVAWDTPSLTELIKRWRKEPKPKQNYMQVLGLTAVGGAEKEPVWRLDPSR